MASAIIHLAIANEINRRIKHDKDKILIGSIAPDIAKKIGREKITSHFLNEIGNNVPNMDKFLAKYKEYLNDDFVLGYFIHLYTDYLWFKYFLPEVFDEDKEYITKLDGTRVKCTDNMFCQYIYNDYTNLNTELIHAYKLDLGVFYRKLPEIENIIQEIPMDKLQIIVDDTKDIIENAHTKKEFIFKLENIKRFIKTSIELILAELNELNIK